MGRILASLATLLILLLGAAFAVPAFVDWNAYRPSIENMASAILGRKVVILGNISAELLPQPHLHASSVAAGDARQGAVHMAASAIDVSLSLEALFSGHLDASSLKLQHPVLTLDFSRPFAEAGASNTGSGLAFAASVRNIEIEDGRIVVFMRAGSGPGGAVTFAGIGGTASASASGKGFRFTGHASKDGQQYEVKLMAAPQGQGLKIDGNLLHPVSKATLRAEGMFTAEPGPLFDGLLSLNLPQSVSPADAFPLAIQAKAAARVGPSEAKFTDIELTFDPQGRAQILTGSATVNTSTHIAGFVLKGRALDAAVLTAGPVSMDSMGQVSAEAGNWDELAAAASRLLWLYPEYAIGLDFQADQIQLRGELIEGVKLHGKRMPGRWVFDEALASLPGESSVKLAGTIAKTAQTPQLTATVAIEGKSAGRLARWLVPSAVAGGRLPLGAYSVKGAVTLSPEVAAIEGITGSLDGTPFKAGLHFERAPARKLLVSLSGENFDLSSIEDAEAGSGGEALASGLKNAWKAALTQLAGILGGGGGFDTADVDISAGSVKIMAGQAKNVALHVKYNGDLITVSKLSAETPKGLAIKAEGSVPLGGTGQGHFGGSIEARTPEALVQAATLAGFDISGQASRAQDLAPAVVTINYTAASGAATAQLDGSLGPARIEGRGQLKGSFADWAASELNAQVSLSGPDGNRLAALLFPKATLPAGAGSPGSLSISLKGPTKKLQTQASLKSPALEVTFNGAAGFNPLSFKGEASAYTQAPEQFIPGPVLALLGGEPKTAFHIKANLAAGLDHVEATDIRAEATANLVTGRLAIQAPAGAAHIEADLKAGKTSLPALLSYFLSTAPEAITASLPSSLTAQAPPPDIWSARPFSLAAFRDTEGSISLSAKLMTFGDGISLTDAQLRATLDKGRLEIGALNGKMLGGTFDAAGSSLAAKDNTVEAGIRLSLTGADFATLAASGTPPIVSGKGSLAFKASGQGFSPRGLISVLHGSGALRFAGGQLPRLNPAAVQARADELLAQQGPLAEDAVTKRALEAAESGDFAFRKLAAYISVADGVLDIPRASFPGLGATVRMEGYIDLNNGLADTTWQLGVSSNRNLRWPPVKVTVSGPLRELGARARAVSAEDLVRAILVRKMEGDISKLEGLSKPANAQPKPAPATLPSAWETVQEPVAPKKPRRKRDAAAKAPDGPAEKTPQPAAEKSFEQRMRDVIDSIGGSMGH